MDITIPGCSFDFHSLDRKPAGAFARRSGEKTFIRIAACGQTNVHLAQSMQMVGSHRGSSSAMSRLSQRDVPTGNAPSTGSAETGSRSPRPAIISAVTYCTTVSYTHLRAHETRHELVCR